MHLAKSLSLLSFIAASVPWVAAQIPVYLTPDVGETPLKTVSNALMEKLDAKPVLDEEQAQQGWKWVDLPGSYTGHVETEQVTKALIVKPSTLVYAAPDTESTVLAVLQDTDEHTVNASSDDWSEVTFTKAITVYFLESPLIAPSVDGLNAPIAEQTPAPQSVPVTVAPAPVSEEELIEELDVFSTDNPNISSLEAQLTTEFKPPSDILITYTGVLSIARKRWFGGKPKTPTELRSPDGKKRLAWLDLENCVLHRSLNELNGLTVAVEAVVMDGDWNSDVLLDVRNVRVLY